MGALAFRVCDGDSGVDNLPSSITLNGITVAPTFIYKGRDFGATQAAAIVGNNLPIAGAGGTPDGTVEGVFTGAGEKFGRFSGGKYYADSGTSFADLTNEDIVIEAVIKQKNEAAGIVCHATSSTSAAGWRLSTRASGAGIIFYISDGTNTGTLTFAGNTAECYYHVIIFVDRSGSMAMYVNGTFATSGTASTVTGSLSVAQPLTLGAYSGGTGVSNGDVAWVALWAQASWLDTHLQAEFAKERASRVMGVFASTAAGQAHPKIMSRSNPAYLDRDMHDGTRKLFRVGNHWQRFCERKESTGGEYLKGFFGEYASTNICLQSEDFNTSWAKGNLTSVSTNGQTAPNNEVTADGIVADATNNAHYVQINVTTSAITWRFSVWAKMGNKRWMGLYTSAVANGVMFDLQNGVVGHRFAATANVTGEMEDWGGGWYRCWITYTGVASSQPHNIRASDNDWNADSGTQHVFTGDASTVNTWLFGAQIEGSSAIDGGPSSYIPTTTGTVARTFDSLRYDPTGGNVPSHPRTIAAKCILRNADYTVGGMLVAHGANSGTNVEFLGQHPTNDRPRVYSAVTSVQWDLIGSSGDVSDGEIHEIRALIDTNNVRAFYDGAQFGTDLTAAPLTPAGDIQLGALMSSANALFGLVSDVRFFAGLYETDPVEVDNGFYPRTYSFGDAAKFLRVNGWPLPVAIGSANERRKREGALGVGFQNRPMRFERGEPTEIEGTALALTREDADCLEGLLSGRGHYFPFDLDAHSTAGLGPDTAASGNWSIQAGSAGLAGDGIFGGGYLNVAATKSITWDTELPRGRWTVMFFKGVSPRSDGTHFVVRADGAKWQDGVRNDAAVTTMLVVDEDLGAVALTAGDYDELVVLPFLASDDFIEWFYRWTTCADLLVDIPILDGTARDVLENVGNPTAAGSPTVLRAGGRAGGCVLFDAAGESLIYTAGVACAYGRSGITAEAWVRPAAGTGERFIIGSKIGTVGWQLSLEDHSFSSGLVAYASVVTAGGLAFQSSPLGPTVDTNLVGIDVETHVAFTWDSTSGEVQIYIDGNALFRHPTYLEDFPGSAASDDSSNDLNVGNNDGLTKPFNGKIAGVRFYGTKLSASEIKERYLTGLAGVPARPPMPFSPLPRVYLDGHAVGFRPRLVLPEVQDQAVIQHARDGSWLNNARNVSFAAPIVVARERRRLPEPLWAFLIDERFKFSSKLRPVGGRVPDATFGTVGGFAEGPERFGRAMYFGASTARAIALNGRCASILGGHTAATVVAWARRGSTGAERGLVTLADATGGRKLDLALTSTAQVQARARATSAEFANTLASSGTLADEARFHLIGAYADIANDEMGVFLDDAGLLTGGAGFYETAAKTFTATRYSIEGYTPESAIGVSNGINNAWSAYIAGAAVYPGVLSPEHVNMLWEMGRRGLLR